MQLISYPTPQAYLQATTEWLEQRELDNNIILGICQAFADPARVQEGCVFLNVLADGAIQATAVTTTVKAVVAGTSRQREHVRLLADHYRQHGIDLRGSIGETFYSRAFSEAYGRPQIGEKAMIVHQLTRVNPLPLASGQLAPADENDVPWLTDWSARFLEDVHHFPAQSREDVEKMTRARVQQGAVYKWIDGGEPVSIAAVVRKTRNLGIMGLVYTPGEHRGKGYATGCVSRLSTLLQASGLKYCGLFTEKSNPTSNHIYREIGYLPSTEFTDIEYGH